MTIFQLILILGVVALIVFGMRLLPGEKSLALKRMFGIIVGFLAIGAIIFPNLLTVIANSVGIGRGTDLLLYMFIIFVMYLTLSVMRAKARSDARVTELARAVALSEARILESLHTLEESDKKDKL